MIRRGANRGMSGMTCDFLHRWRLAPFACNGVLLAIAENSRGLEHFSLLARHAGRICSGCYLRRRARQSCRLYSLSGVLVEAVARGGEKIWILFSLISSAGQ